MNYVFDSDLSSVVATQAPPPPAPKAEGPLSPELLDTMLRYWEASNYLTVGQIYLQANPDTLVERVKRRGIEIEADISEHYLRALADSYSRYFYHYDAAPLLIVNTEHLNPVDREEDFQLLVKQLASLRGRRSFFNRG